MSKLEEKIIEILKKEKIFFQREKTFSDLRKGKYRFDFYLPNVGGAPAIIEVNGQQHYQQVKKFQPKRADFLAQKERDRRKISYCLAHGLRLYIIPYWEIDNVKTVNDLLNPKYRARSRWHCDKQKNLTKA